MSEDVIGKLTRLTPDAAGIDRDEWLFRAGRASARAPRIWKWAAGVLAVTQAVTAAAWLAAPRPPAPSAAVEPAPAATEPTPSDDGYPPDPASYGSLARTFDPDAPPPPAGFAAPARPVGTLTAGSRGLIE